MKELLTQDKLREFLHYDQDSGVFTWKVKRRPCFNVGDEAGGEGASKDGYIRIRVNRIKYLAHRLAWLYVLGQFPPYHIDHINGNRKDNRIANLRQATRIENARNRARRKDNTSGFTGVSFDNKTKKWKVQCSAEGKRIVIGYFKTPLEASEVYEKFISDHWGDFKPNTYRKINDRIAPIILIDGGLEAMGFTDAKIDQFPLICAALVRHIEAASSGQKKAA